MKKKAVVVLSGGLDSTVLLYEVINKGYEAYAISYHYWQKHSKELEFAKKTCERLGVNHKVVDITFLNDILKSNLLLSWGEIPEWGYETENMKDTVVPNRNMIFTSIATGYAQSIGAEIVALGIHNGDHDIYPDCREEFIEKLNSAIEVSDYNKVSLYYPLIMMKKEDIVLLWLELGVDFSLTWSCYKGNDLACGKCWTCAERLEAFEKNGITDFIRYQ